MNISLYTKAMTLLEDNFELIGKEWNKQHSANVFNRRIKSYAIYSACILLAHQLMYEDYIASSKFYKGYSKNWTNLWYEELPLMINSSSGSIKPSNKVLRLVYPKIASKSKHLKSHWSAESFYRHYLNRTVDNWELTSQMQIDFVNLTLEIYRGNIEPERRDILIEYMTTPTVASDTICREMELKETLVL